jgi:hypothetical protein
VIALMWLATSLQITLAVWSALALTAAAHSALAYVDVAYTEKRRRISPLEQLAHHFLEVLPWVAVGLLAVLSWPLARAPAFAPSEWVAPQVRTWLLISLGIIAGLPIVEELVRSLRAQRAEPGTEPRTGEPQVLSHRAIRSG